MSNRVRVIGSIVEVDMTSPRGGSSSARNQFVSEPNTVVYYGTMHACVKMLDLGLEVAFDPYEGDWKNGKWAREQAFEAIKANLDPELWMDIFEAIAEASKRIGRNDLRESLKEMLKLEY